MVDDLTPDIAFLSEANLCEHDNDHETNIEGYELIKSMTMTRYGISRIVALVKENFKHKIMTELMDDQISSIWLKIGGQGRKKHNCRWDI